LHLHPQIQKITLEPVADLNPRPADYESLDGSAPGVKSWRVVGYLFCSKLPQPRSRTIADSFSNMRYLDAITRGEVGDSARHLEDAVMRPCR